MSPAIKRVVERYARKSCGGFPTAEISKLVPGSDAGSRSLFHGRIDMYLSGIAGYASSASRLERRSEKELSSAQKFLSEPFFRKYPEHAPYAAIITAVETPILFKEMQASELNRQDLLEEVERMLKVER